MSWGLWVRDLVSRVVSKKMTCSSLTSFDMDASGDEVGERKTIWRDKGAGIWGEKDVGFFEPLDFFFFCQVSPI